jgi:hypothetical protein
MTRCLGPEVGSRQPWPAWWPTHPTEGLVLPGSSCACAAPCRAARAPALRVPTIPHARSAWRHRRRIEVEPKWRHRGDTEVVLKRRHHQHYEVAWAEPFIRSPGRALPRLGVMRGDYRCRGGTKQWQELPSNPQGIRFPPGTPGRVTGAMLGAIRGDSCTISAADTEARYRSCRHQGIIG